MSTGKRKKRVEIRLDEATYNRLKSSGKMSESIRLAIAGLPPMEPGQIALIAAEMEGVKIQLGNLYAVAVDTSYEISDQILAAMDRHDMTLDMVRNMAEKMKKKAN